MEVYRKTTESPDSPKELERLGENYKTILKNHLDEILKKMREIDEGEDKVHCLIDLKKMFPEVRSFWESISNNRETRNYLDDIGEDCLIGITWQNTEMRSIVHTGGRVWWTSHHYGSAVGDEASKEGEDPDALLEELERKIEGYDRSDKSYNAIVGVLNVISGLNLSDEQREKLRILRDRF